MKGRNPSMKKNGRDVGRSPDSTGVEPSDAEAEPGLDARRGLPGRQTSQQRTQAVLDLLAGKAIADQLARRFGTLPAAVEGWRQEAVTSIAGGTRHGQRRSPRKVELERKAFTNLAIKHEFVAVGPLIDCGDRALLDIAVSKNHESPCVLAPSERSPQVVFANPTAVPEGLELRTDHESRQHRSRPRGDS